MFDVPYDYCKECGNKRSIVNKKYWMCEMCNTERRQKNREVKNLTYPDKPKKSQQLQPFSKKEEKNVAEMHEVYNQIDEERERVCSGCGQSSMLSHAHLISQRNKKYQADKDNIVFDCMEREVPDQFGNLGCHARWESKQWDKIITLNNYEYRLNYIKERDSINYQKILLSKK
jgi:hypothetical protein